MLDAAVSAVKAEQRINEFNASTSSSSSSYWCPSSSSFSSSSPFNPIMTLGSDADEKVGRSGGGGNAFNVHSITKLPQMTALFNGYHPGYHDAYHNVNELPGTTVTYMDVSNVKFSAAGVGKGNMKYNTPNVEEIKTQLSDDDSFTYIDGKKFRQCLFDGCPEMFLLTGTCTQKLCKQHANRDEWVGDDSATYVNGIRCRQCVYDGCTKTFSIVGVGKGHKKFCDQHSLWTKQRDRGYTKIQRCNTIENFDENKTSTSSQRKRPISVIAAEIGEGIGNGDGVNRVQRAATTGIDVAKMRQCLYDGCTEMISFAGAGKGQRKYCEPHAMERKKQRMRESNRKRHLVNDDASIIYVKGKRCRQCRFDGCTEVVSIAGKKRGKGNKKYCDQHSSRTKQRDRGYTKIQRCNTIENFDENKTSTSSQRKRPISVIAAEIGEGIGNGDGVNRVQRAATTGIDVAKMRQCLYDGCTEMISFAGAGKGQRKYCEPHAMERKKQRMRESNRKRHLVNDDASIIYVKGKRCRQCRFDGCTEIVSIAGNKGGRKYCTPHAEELKTQQARASQRKRRPLVDDDSVTYVDGIRCRQCVYDGCTELIEIAGTKHSRKYCKPHSDEMHRQQTRDSNLRLRRCQVIENENKDSNKACKISKKRKAH